MAAEFRQGIDCQPSASNKSSSSSSLSFEEKLERSRQGEVTRYNNNSHVHVPRRVAGAGRNLGEFGNLDEGDYKSLIARPVVFRVAPSVVGLQSFVGKKHLFACSGIIIDWTDMAGTIVTCATLLIGFSDSDTDVVCSDVEVKVQLPNRETVSGFVSYFDIHHNIAVIGISSASPLQAASLQPEPKPLHPGHDVVAVGRNYRSYTIMASHGEVKHIDNAFDSDDLLFSTCSITEYGIGGPLVDICSGLVVGMNFSNTKKCTAFLSSTIVLRCLKHFKNYGVFRPWLGMRTQLLDTLKTAQLETIYQIFPDVNGALVEKVMKGSPADSAGICPGDIITYCDANVVCSPLEFVEILFDKAEKLKELGCDWASDHALKRRTIAVEVTIKRSSSGCTEMRSIIVDRLSPFENNRWPLIRPEDSKPPGKKYYH